MSYPSEPPTLVSRYSLLNVTLKCALITVANRYTDGETARLEGRVCPSPILPITMASRSPVSSPSWDISSESSAESGFVPDAPTSAEPIPEQIGFGGMYYDHVQNGHYQHRWEFSDSGHGHSAPPRILAHPAARGIPVGPSPSHVVSARDDASTAKRPRLRRGVAQCSVPGNWWVTEATYLSQMIDLTHPQLCNKCGLFERTHAIPRPQKFPRRRSHNSKAVRTPPAHPDMRMPPGDGFVNRHSKGPHSPALPIATHLLHALDPISGEIFPQHVPWHSPDAADSASARVNRCHPPTEQPAMYHASGQLPPTVLPGALWI